MIAMISTNDDNDNCGHDSVNGNVGNYGDDWDGDESVNDRNCGHLAMVAMTAGNDAREVDNAWEADDGTGGNRGK